MLRAEILTEEEIEDQIALYREAIDICKHQDLRKILEKRICELIWCDSKENLDEDEDEDYDYEPDAMTLAKAQKEEEILASIHD